MNNAGNNAGCVDISENMILCEQNGFYFPLKFQRLLEHYIILCPYQVYVRGRIETGGLRFSISITLNYSKDKQLQSKSYIFQRCNEAHDIIICVF